MATALASSFDTTETATTEDWRKIAQQLGADFATRSAAHDANDTFVTENYITLKHHRLFSAGVPAELGGGGASHADLCAILRELAHGCGSTALALSMHTHLLAATVWRWHQGQPVEPLLKRIVAEQLVLVSTGASDWVESSGTAQKVEGGYHISGRKVFASGCPMGNVLVTSASYDDPEDGPTVLHFPVPLRADGVTIMESWRTLGMRATGSHDVVLSNVFVPDSAITLRRPKGKWHPFWNVVVTVAMPLIMAVYVGIAEAAAALARQEASKKSQDASLPYLVGEMENALVTAQMALQGMIELAADYRFAPINETASAVLIRKTIAANAVLHTAEKALEVVGGAGFFRSLGLERLLRDAHGAIFHPLPEKRQLLFTGRLALGLDPIG